jgi:hypothetical protein
MTLQAMTFRCSLLSLVVLSACSSATIPDTGLENQIKYQPLEASSAASAMSPGNGVILNEVFAKQSALGVCQDTFNLEQSKNGSKLYHTGPDQYLVQLLCFQAAYQGNYAFLTVDRSQVSTNIIPLELGLAGSPNFDPETRILSNGYKFRGIGDCIESTEHRWTGDDFVLLSATLVEALPQSCELFKGGESFQIRSTQVGMAKLGMTLGELKAAMGDEASFTPTVVGVDQGKGMEVRNYGEVQFTVGSGADLPMTDSSVITLIRVSHPAYKTPEGVGPGTVLKTAIAHYGKVTLSLNLENESRETLTFEQGFPKTVWIQSNQWALDGQAGLYADSTASDRTTDTFKDKAAIGSITIVQPPQ